MSDAGRLKVVTAPALEPLHPEEVKLHARIDIDTDDPLLYGYIRAARELYETEGRQTLITTTYDLTLDEFPDCGHIDLPKPPLQSVTSVTYYDTDNAATVWASSNYYVDTASYLSGRLALAYGKLWPTATLRPHNGVVIRYVAGFGDGPGDVPESIRQWMQLAVAHWYVNREATVSASYGNKQVEVALETLLWANRTW